MFRKSIVKDLSGNIITLMDEADGGYIIRNRQIVNPAKWEELQKKERDKQEAAKAQSMEKRDNDAPDRTVTATVARENNTRMEKLETKVDSMGGDIATILKLLNEKKS